MRTKRREWVAKNIELQRLTREGKFRKWRGNLEKIDREKNAEDAWRMVRGLGGERQEAGESIEYNGRRCTSDKAKANAFIQEYVKISKAESNKEIRKTSWSWAILTPTTLHGFLNIGTTKSWQGV